jgi:hypothetical protein
MYRNFSKGSKMIVLSGVIAAGAADITNLAGVDTFGFSGCAILVQMGALSATQVTSLRGQYSNDDAAADPYADIEGSSTGNALDADSNKLLVLDIYRPKKRYIKPIIKRATANAVITSVVVILYDAASEPVAASSTTSKVKTLASPGLGDA